MCTPKGQCSGSATSSTTCNNRPCEGGSMKPQWSEWSAWTDCSRTCGTGLQTRSRQCLGAGDASLECDGDYRKSGQMKEDGNCNTHSCHFQPGPSGDTASWGFWGEWTPCTKTCLSGFHSRSRRCMLGSQSEVFGCENDSSGTGIDVKYEACNTQICTGSKIPGGEAAWSQWPSWSVCSATCGTGYKERTAKCMKNGAEAATGCKGDPSGIGIISEYQNCNSDSCFGPPGGLAEWDHWSIWGDCSLTCGNGNRKRSRECVRGGERPSLGCRDDHEKNGVQNHHEACNTQSCVVVPPPPPITQGEAAWSQWPSWSVCSATCGTGYKERTAKCMKNGEELATGCEGDPGGTGIMSDYQNCNTESCSAPPAGLAEWDDWSIWGDCSVTCGNGNRKRSRECVGGGGRPSLDCQDDHEKKGVQTHHEACNTQSCVVVTTTPPPITQGAGKWSEWGEWTACSKTCGSGTQVRERTCYDAAQLLSADCVQQGYSTGVEMEYQSCGGGECESGLIYISGPMQQWGTWGSWSSCTTTCAGGHRKRIRKCLKDGKTPTKGCFGDWGFGELHEYLNCGTVWC